MRTPKPERAAPPTNGGPTARFGRALTLLVTNLVKLGGLWISIHEIATQAQPRLVVMAIALFMMTGAQVSEEAVLKLASRVFGVAHEKPPER